MRIIKVNSFGFFYSCYKVLEKILLTKVDWNNEITDDSNQRKHLNKAKHLEDLRTIF